jgi:hypothetical protein
VECLQRNGTGVGKQIRATPSIGWLIQTHIVAARLQLGDDAAQKVCVTVIPVGNERVIEERKAHAASF